MILAIDLGGTKLQYGIFTPTGSIVDTDIVSTKADFLTQLKQLIQTQHRNYPELSIVSLGVPGPTVDNKMQGSKPLNCLQTIDFGVELAEIHIPTIVRNDLHMAAQFEIREGAGKKYRQFCIVSISTGIGVSVVNGGTILNGRTEMGHQILLPDFKPPQSCTNHRNCWVALASGAGIVRRFGKDNYTTTKEIFAHVLSSDDIAELRIINAHAFGNLISAYDPEAIVIMGSVGLHQFSRIKPSSSEIERFTINRPIPPIVKSKSGKNAGMLGAFYAAQEFQNSNAHN